MSDEALFGLTMFSAFAVGAVAGLLPGRLGLLLVLVLSLASAALHRWVIAPVPQSAPILPPFVVNIAAGLAVLVAASLGLRLALAIRSA